MYYCSTRDESLRHNFLDVLMNGMAPDGGLYVPVHWPISSREEWKGYADLSYADLAFELLRHFIGDALPDSALRRAIDKVYGAQTTKFLNQDITPLHQLDDHLHVMELFHGPTLAFKDVALQLLGALFDEALSITGKKITIIGATSGDTGSAAIEGCAGCANARIMILHPHNRTSEVQRRQMTTVLSDNVINVALQGTFDDAQSIVKALFADEQIRKTHNLTAINSINWARIMAQSVYYAYTALKLGAPEEKIAFTVPTGNFGNVYAAYVCWRMGLPFERLIVASNKNDIMSRVINDAEMAKTSVSETLSPSMDIQISSNFERLLFDLFDRDGAAVKDALLRFYKGETVALTQAQHHKLQKMFLAYAVSDDQTLERIKQCHKKYNYVLDPHSAVGYAASLQARGDLSAEQVIVTLACAHPAKFPDAVMQATGQKPELPALMADLFDREERFQIVENNKDAVLSCLESHTLT